MPLQKNVVDLVLAGGQDEKADPRLAVRALNLQNTRYAKRGSLSKRFGSKALTPNADLQNNRYTALDMTYRKVFGTESQTVCNLVASKEELLRCSRGALDRFIPIIHQPPPPVFPGNYAPGPLAPLDTLPHHHVDRQGYPTATGAPAHLDTYGTLLASIVIIAGGFVVEIRDATTLEVVTTYSSTSLSILNVDDTVGAAIVLSPDAVSGEVAPTIFYVDTSARLQAFDVLTHATAIVASNVLRFDVTPAVFDSGAGHGVDTCFIVWTDTAASSNRVRVASVRQTVVLGSLSRGGADPLPDWIAIDAKAGGARVHVAYSFDNAGVATLKAFASNALAVPTNAWGPVTLSAVAPGIGQALGVKSIGPTGSECVWVYTLKYMPSAFAGGATWDATYYARTDATGTITDASPGQGAFPGVYTVSKPWVDEIEAVYLVGSLSAPDIVAGPGGTTYAILRLAPDTGTAGTPRVYGGPRAEWDGFLAPLLAYYAPLGNYNTGCTVAARTVQDRTADGGTARAISVLLPYGVVSDPAAPEHPLALYTFVPVSSYGTADAIEDYVFSASAIMSYDGDRCFECAYPERPWTFPVGTETTAGGGLVQGARYGYRYCVSYRDARGVLHRSGPSDPIFHTMTTVGDTLNVLTSERFYVPTRRFQGIGDSANGIYTVEEYRTEANGATFYLESVDNSATIGTLSDTDLRTRPILYTTGGALEHACPPSARYAVLALGRVFLLGTEDGYVWPSGSLVQGEAPWWNATLSFPVPGLGPITGGIELDQNLIVFREGAIFAVNGDGPADSGDGSFAIQPIASDIGCIDARSLCKVPEGVLFLSRDGIAILTRSFTVVRVGKGVEDYLRGAEAQEQVGVTAAVNVPTETEIRFSLQRYDGSKVQEAATVYRLDGMDEPSWAEMSWSSHGVAGGMRVASACLYENLYTWITDAGFILQEDTSTWLDAFTVGSTPAYVPMVAWLAPWKPGPVQAWVRVWRVGILGAFRDAHTLTVEIFHDYDDAPVTTRQWLASELVGLSAEQLKVHVVRQKSEAVGVRVTDSAPTDVAVSTGEGLVLAGVALEIGVKPGMHRRPAVAKR